MMVTVVVLAVMARPTQMGKEKWDGAGETDALMQLG
jgi:hypothetical protein